MKIGILHGWLLDGSGSNVYTRSLARALRERGHEVHLFCQEPRPERFAELGTIHVPDIGRELMPVYVADTEYPGFAEVREFPELAGDPRLERYLERFAAGVESVCRAAGVAVLHANHVYPMPEVARRVKERLGVPYLVFPHGSAIEYAVKRSPAIAAAAARAIDAADALVIGNETVARRLFGLYPEREAAWRRKHRIVSVGVDPGLFAPVPRGERRASAARLAAALARAPAGAGRKSPDPDLAAKLEQVDWERDRILLYMGKLIAAKGVRDLLLAWPEILARVPRARLLLVGEGPLRDELEAAGPERALFTGYLPHELLRHLLPCADLAVFPSVVAEAYPLVLLEAISAGVLPMASYFEGLADGLDAIAARLPGDLAPHMRIAMAPDRRAASIVAGAAALLAREPDWGPACRALAEREYSWAAVAERMEEVYRAIARRT